MKPTVIPSGIGSVPSPEKDAAVRPTAIPAAPVPPTAPVAPRPTVIPSGRPAAAPQETGAPAAAPVPAVRRPTVIVGPPAGSVAPAPAPAPAVPRAQPSAPPASAVPAVSVPTTVPGKRRVRIPVTDEAIFLRSPHMRSEIRARVIQLIDTVNVDDMSERGAVLWGHEAQKEYAALVGRSLDLSQYDVLARVTRHVTRLSEILGLIDLRRVCGIEEGGMFDFLRRNPKQIDTPAKLEAARVELEQLVKRMHERIDALLALQGELEQVKRETERLGDEMEALAEAGAFVADHLMAVDPTKSGLASRFMERGGSLTQSLAQIRASGSTRQLQVEQPLLLIAAVQHATLVAMPDWLSSIATVLAMLQGARKPNATEVDELGQSTAKILQGLNAK